MQLASGINRTATLATTIYKKENILGKNIHNNVLISNIKYAQKFTNVPTDLLQRLEKSLHENVAMLLTLCVSVFYNFCNTIL